MIDLTTTTSTQTFYFIPKDYNITACSVTDDISGSAVTIASQNFTREGDFVKCEIELTGLINNRFYTLNCEEKYKDKIIVTDDFNSVTQDWDINKNKYTEHTTPNNDYIVI